MLALTRRKIVVPLALLETVKVPADQSIVHPLPFTLNQREVTVRIMDEEDQLAHMIDVEKRPQMRR